MSCETNLLDMDHKVSPGSTYTASICILYVSLAFTLKPSNKEKTTNTRKDNKKKNLFLLTILYLLFCVLYINETPFIKEHMFYIYFNRTYVRCQQFYEHLFDFINIIMI